MRRGKKILNYPEQLKVYVTAEHKDKAEKKAEALGFPSVSEMIRQYIMQEV